VLRAETAQEALRVIEHAKLSVAVVSFRLGEETSSQLCARLRKLLVPIVHRTDHGSVSVANPDEPIVFATTGQELLVATVAKLRRHA
jgi:DNA-binding LytR/AlgR family response regulator